MSAISKPAAADLAPLLAEATENGKVTEDEWRKKLLSSFTRVLTRNPLHYRCFGPYWWSFKTLLLEQGIAAFGDRMDAEWREKMDYGSSTLNLLASYAYYDTAFDQGLLLSQMHSVSYEDGEAEDYVLIDEDMEILAMERGL
ncbi:MAG: hypothetical protein U0M13_09160 [Desulfovibrio fairfieldensis]|nr:hypothetical protein [Desulfovibrio fairfieldensis]